MKWNWLEELAVLLASNLSSRNADAVVGLMPPEWHSQTLRSPRNRWTRSFHSRQCPILWQRHAPHPASPNHLSVRHESMDFDRQNMINMLRHGTYNANHFCNRQEWPVFRDKSVVSLDTTWPSNFATMLDSQSKSTIKSHRIGHRRSVDLFHGRRMCPINATTHWHHQPLPTTVLAPATPQKKSRKGLIQSIYYSNLRELHLCRSDIDRWPIRWAHGSREVATTTHAYCMHERKSNVSCRQLYHQPGHTSPILGEAVRCPFCHSLVNRTQCELNDLWL